MNREPDTCDLLSALLGACRKHRRRGILPDDVEAAVDALAGLDIATERLKIARRELNELRARRSRCNGGRLNQGLLTSEVARKYGISATTVHRMDAELRPFKTSAGLRVFDPAIVEAYFAKRAAAKAAK